MLILRGLVSGLFQLALFASALLIPAGTWNWPRGLWLLAAYGVLLTVSIVWLAIFAPSSLEARLERPAHKKQAPGDRAATAFIGAALLGWMVFIPLDVFRFHIFPAPTFAVSVFGAAVFFLGYAIIITALYQNAFATPVVRDQSERGHSLVDSGLYARVRHPFYSGVLLFLLGMALWLESYAAVLALLVVLASLIVRIRVEEKALRETLPGYTEYTARVRYRLIPGIW